VIPAIRAAADSRLVAVASRDADCAEAYAGKWHILRSFGNYEAMIHDPEIDVIYIPLPNHLHASWTIKALEAGKHVLCEKPMALSVTEMDAISAAAKASGYVATEGFMYRHHPRTERVRSLVNEGAIGALHFIRGAFTFRLDRPADVRWNAAWGGGSLWDVGCYPVHFARYVIGSEPIEVFARQVTGESGVDVTFAGVARFPGDVLFQFDAGIRSRFRMEMEFVGNKGTIVVPRAFKPDREGIIQIYDASNDEARITSVPGSEQLYLGEINDMARAICEGEQPRVSLLDSRANVRVLEALAASAHEGRLVRLAEEQRPDGW